MFFKQELSQLKIKFKKEINILKNDIKENPLKYVTSIIFFVYPLKSYAKETIGKIDKLQPNEIDKNTSPNSKSNLYQFGLDIIGLRNCFDPSATPFQKFLYCSRPCCLVAGLTAGYIAEKSAIGTPVHKAATVCCASSWSIYAALTLANSEKVLIKKEK